MVQCVKKPETMETKSHSKAPGGHKIWATAPPSRALRISKALAHRTDRTGLCDVTYTITVPTLRTAPKVVRMTTQIDPIVVKILVTALTAFRKSSMTITDKGASSRCPPACAHRAIRANP